MGIMDSTHRPYVLLLLLLLLSASVVSDSVLPHRRGHTVSGILQARTLEWVAISFSNA